MRRIAIAASAVVLLILPVLTGPDYYLHVAITALVFVILATSLDLLVGVSGLLSLGHTAFFAIGAYACGATASSSSPSPSPRSAGSSPTIGPT